MSRALKYVLGIFVLVAMIAVGMQYIDEAKAYIEGKVRSEVDNAKDAIVDEYSENIEKQLSEQFGGQLPQP